MQIELTINPPGTKQIHPADLDVGQGMKFIYTGNFLVRTGQDAFLRLSNSSSFPPKTYTLDVAKRLDPGTRLPVGTIISLSITL